VSRWICTLSVLALACGPTQPTQLLVVIRSDMLVPERLDSISLELLREPDPPLGPFLQIVDPANRYSVPLPVTVSLRARTDPSREVTVIASAIRRGIVHSEQRARVRFVRSEAHVLCMRLDEACYDVSCAAGSTCSGGVCVPITDVLDLPAYQDASVASCDALPVPDAGVIFVDAAPDGGQSDASIGGGDAGARRDGG
jgi:hypothetical protein